MSSGSEQGTSPKGKVRENLLRSVAKPPIHDEMATTTLQQCGILRPAYHPAVIESAGENLIIARLPHCSSYNG